MDVPEPAPVLAGSDPGSGVAGLEQEQLMETALHLQHLPAFSFLFPRKGGISWGWSWPCHALGAAVGLGRGSWHRGEVGGCRGTVVHLLC